MKRVSLALVLALPTLASAQTPANLAALAWPNGPPAPSSTSSPTTLSALGAFAPADLTRRFWPNGVPAPRMTPPPPPRPGISGMTGADLARAFAPSLPSDQPMAPVRLVSAAPSKW